MDSTTAAAIQKAYELVKAGNHSEAQAILIPLVRTNPNIAEAWYVLGFALSDPEKRLYAFRQVVRIDPSNRLAQNQITKLTAPKQSTSPFTVMPDLTDTPAPARAAHPVAQNKPEDEPAPAVKKKTPKKKSIWPVLAGFAAMVACFVVVGLVLIVRNGLQAQAFPFFFYSSPTPTSRPSTPTPVVTPSPTPYIPAFHGTACPFTVPLGTRVRCGTVRVPQDRRKNLTELIELPVVLYQSSKPDADAVIFLQGGPGAESIDWSLALFQDYVTPILANHDMIFFDPRGTGRSKPSLDCPELNAVFLDAYYQNRSQDDAFADFLKLWGKCHERFLAQGVNPAAFNTIESAADVHDIVTALGYQQVNLLGISYGTRLGLAVMRDYPEIVRSAVLDSVVPMDGKMFNRRASDVQYALNKVFTNCAGSPRCNAAYPDLNYIFNNLIEQFDQKPAKIKAYDPSTGYTIDVTANGVDMISAVVAGMHNSQLVPVIPKAIYDIQKGDYTFLTYALGTRGGTYNTTGLGTYFSTVCPEQVYVSTQQELDADLNVTPLIKQFSLDGLFGSTQNLFALCKAWGAEADDPRDILPVKSDIPTLVISGQYDPTTPSTTGEIVANDLGNSHFYVIPGMGHGATIGNACSLAITLAFLKNPEKAPDSSCLQAKPFEFFLPYDGEQPMDLIEVTDSVNGLQELVPAGWKRQRPDAPFFRDAYLFDVTLVQATAFGYPKDVVLTLLTQSFQDGGFSGTPQRVDTHSVNGLSWTVYTSKFNGEPVFVALAQATASRTLALIMVVSAPERDAFYKGLFIPMLDGLIPLY